MNFKERISRIAKVSCIPYIEHQTLQQSETINNASNQISTQLKFAKFDTSEKLKHLRCSDFSLSNLLSLGKDLNFTQSTVSNKLNIIDNL